MDVGLFEAHGDVEVLWGEAHSRPCLLPALPAHHAEEDLVGLALREPAQTHVLPVVHRCLRKRGQEALDGAVSEAREDSLHLAFRDQRNMTLVTVSSHTIVEVLHRHDQRRVHALGRCRSGGHVPASSIHKRTTQPHISVVVE